MLAKEEKIIKKAERDLEKILLFADSRAYEEVRSHGSSFTKKYQKYGHIEKIGDYLTVLKEYLPSLEEFLKYVKAQVQYTKTYGKLEELF